MAQERWNQQHVKLRPRGDPSDCTQVILYAVLFTLTSLLSGLLTIDSAIFWSMKKRRERGKPSIIPARITFRSNLDASGRWNTWCTCSTITSSQQSQLQPDKVVILEIREGNRDCPAKCLRFFLNVSVSHIICIFVNMLVGCLDYIFVTMS